MAFEKLFDASNAAPFKFESKGTVLEGYFMGSFEHNGDYGKTKKHIFKTAQGAVVVFGQTNLMQQLPSAVVGAMTRITYKDDKLSDKKGRHPMKLFEIEQDKKEKIDVVGVDLTPTESYDDNTDDVDAETDVDSDDAVDEAPPAKAQAPKKPAVAPDAERQRKVQELLNRGKSKTL